MPSPLLAAYQSISRSGLSNAWLAPLSQTNNFCEGILAASVVLQPTDPQTTFQGHSEAGFHALSIDIRIPHEVPFHHIDAHTASEIVVLKVTARGFWCS